jgi:hypothetical protein
LSSKKAVQEALARHRDQPSVLLDMSFPINWQLDQTLSEVLSTDLKLAGSSWEIMQATPTLWTQLPDKTGIYMFVYRSHIELQLQDGSLFTPKTVLYVGRAGNVNSKNTLRKRYKAGYVQYIDGSLEELWGHNGSRARADMLRRYLTLWPLQYWFLVIEDCTKIASIEDRLIKIFSPPLNINGRLRAKFGPQTDAFRTPI